MTRLIAAGRRALGWLLLAIVGGAAAWFAGSALAATIHCTGGTCVGTNGFDVIYGTAGGDGIYGLDGYDGISGGGGADFIAGGNGSDNISGDGDVDYIYGENLNDAIQGNGGGDLLRGDGGDESNAGGLWGGTENDDARGGGGTDRLITWDDGSGGDASYGEEGLDTCYRNVNDNAFSCEYQFTP